MFFVALFVRMFNFFLTPLSCFCLFDIALQFFPPASSFCLFLHSSPPPSYPASQLKSVIKAVENLRRAINNGLAVTFPFPLSLCVVITQSDAPNL